MSESIDATWRMLLDERQQKEVSFSELYATEYKHGTANHNAYLLIARLAQLLDVAAGLKELPKPPVGGELVLTFGKYRDKSLAQIWMTDPGYVEWLAREGRDQGVRAAAMELLAPTPVDPEPIEDEGEDPLL
jgi:exodeoxyribonuclease X-like protein